MKRVIIYAVAAIFIVSLFALNAHGWRRENRTKQRVRSQSYTIKNPDKFKGCQSACQKKYGLDGAKCKTMEIDAKKTCRQSSRSCNANCWNKYR
jgi:hypothetical protein